jgi:putative ABC transport system permease protein
LSASRNVTRRAIALILCAVGLYGMLAFAVSRRTREIGIRMAIGAQSRNVLRLVVGQGLVPVVIGLTLGLLLARSATTVLENMLYETHQSDPLTIAMVVVVLMSAAAAAIIIPARQAIRVDPVIALN